MLTNQLLPDGEPAHPAIETASQQVAAALRRGRLTLLCGHAAAETSALLIDGVWPKLRRRGADAIVSVVKRPLEIARPSPDRRSGGHAALSELAILVSDWATPSQSSLHDGIDAALRAAGVDPEWYREPLTERVQSLSSRFGTRFLFVLDGFEAVLEGTGDKEARADLLGELVHLLNTPVPANLLISLRADAEPLLSPVLDRLHAVRPEVLMLEGERTQRIYGPAKAATGTATPQTQPAPPAPQAAVKPQPTQLSQFDSARMPEAANTGAPTRPGVFGEAAMRVRDRPAPPEAAVTAPPAPPRPPRRLTSRRLAAFAAIVFAAIAGGAVWFRAALPGASNLPVQAALPADTIAAALTAAPVTPVTRPAPTSTATPVTAVTPTPAAPIAPPPEQQLAAAPTAAAPPLLPVPAVRPAIALRVDTDNAAGPLPRELAAALAADGGAALQIVPTPLALPAAGTRGAAPGLAIVRYDALQAAARGATKPDLSVIAPLYTEELQIVVRADSPLQFIHQIEGKRINVGAAQGARAVTAGALYRQMFDRPPPAAKLGTRDAASALQQLLGGGDIDVVVLVGPQPAAALAALPPAQRRALKLLALAPADTASRRALQAYLPATLRDPAGGSVPSLAAMSFLVATGTPDADTAKTLGRLTDSLCRNLPGLQRHGDAKWRLLRAGLQLETGWPQAGTAEAEAEAAWRACGGADVNVSNASPTRTSSPVPTLNRN